MTKDMAYLVHVNNPAMFVQRETQDSWSNHTCPRCGESDIRRSMMRNVLERMIRWLTGFRPYRCCACLHRFWGFQRRSELKSAHQNLSVE